VADDHRLVNEGVVLDRHLDVLRRDVLPTGGDDDVLLAAGDVEVALFVESAEVTRVQPTFGLQRLARGLLVLEVPEEYVRTPEDDLAIIGDLYLDPRQRRADAPELRSASEVERGRAAALRLAVDLLDHEIQAREERVDLLADRRRAADEGLRGVEPDRGLELREDEALRERVLERKHARRLLAAVLVLVR